MSRWASWCCCLAGAASMARAQLPFDVPKPATPTAAALFASQCGTCHVATQRVSRRDRGPISPASSCASPARCRSSIIRPASPGPTFVWDDAHLDAWLTNPQKLIPGAVMLYRQADPAIRASIIAWLKEQH